MIFKTITDNVTGSTKSISIFNSTLGTIQRNLKNGQGITYSFFGGNQLRKSDIDALNSYINGIKSGLTPAQSWRENLSDCSVAAKQYVLEAKKAGKSTNNLATDLKQIPKVSKASQVALKSLAATGNMIAMWGISVVISKVAEGIQYLASANERYLENQQEIVNKTQSQIAEYDAEIESLNNLQEKLIEARGNKEKLSEIQNDLNNAIGQTPSLLNGEYAAWSVANQKITDRIALLQKLREEELTKNIQATKNIYDNNEVDNKWGIDEKLTDYFDTSQFKELVNKYFDQDSKSFAEILAVGLENKPYSNDFHFGNPNAEEIQKYLDKQYSIIAPLFSEYISSLKTTLSKESLEIILKELVYINPDDASAVKNQFNDFIKALEKNGLDKAYDNFLESFGDYTIDTQALYENLRDVIDSIIEDFPFAKHVLNNFFSTVGTHAVSTNVSSIGVIGSKLADEINKKTSFIDALQTSESYSDYLSKFQTLAESGDLSSDTLSSTEEYSNLLQTLGYNADEAVLSLKKFFGILDYGSMMDGLKDSLSPIIEAQLELSKNGKLSFDTTQSLLNIQPDLIEQLQAVEGGYTTTDEALQNLINTKLLSFNFDNNDAVDAANNVIESLGGEAIAYGLTTDEIIEQIKAEIALLQTKELKQKLIAKNVSGTLKSVYNTIDNDNPITNSIIAGIDTIENGLQLPTGNIGFYSDEIAELNSILEQIDAAKTNTANALEIYNSRKQNITDNFNASSSSDNNISQAFDWIETKLNNISEALDKTNTKVNNTYSSWTDRNIELSNAVSKTKEAIDLQKQAFSAYMEQAKSVNLPNEYKILIEKGALQIQDISDSDLADKVSEYQDFYNKAINCLDTAEELNQSLNELSTSTKWNNIKTELDSIIDKFDVDINIDQTQLDNLELRGLFANSSYYTDMASLTQKKINTLTSEASQLQSILKGMSQGNEAYDTMFSELMSIRQQIAELENDCIEFNNNANSLNWEIFEYLEESLNHITDETAYLIELLSKKDLFNENGQITNYGTASIALHAAAYDVYKQQAQDYYEEVQDLQKQLVNGAGKKVLEQYNAMVDAHQEAVLAAEEEKQSILDLIEDGYNAQLDALQKLIDKKKEQLNAEKNLYDYQKSIKEQTDNISSLEKQKLAYEGVTSEEAMSKIQQIKVKLEEAKAELKESEYEQYLSDTETMLDQLSEDYENWMNERLDNSDELLKQIIGEISSQGSSVNTTLQEVSNEYGTFVSDSLNTIFNSDSPFTKSLTGKLNDVSNSLNSGLGGVSTSVAGTTTAINDLVNKIAGITGTAADNTNAGTNVAANDSDNKASNAATNSSVNNKPSSNDTNNGNSNNPSTNLSASSASNNTKTGKALLDSILISKKDYYPKGSLNIDTSVIDRLKYKDKDSSFSARAMYWDKIFGGTYTGSSPQNTKLLNYLKSNDYKSGTSNATKGYHWTQEDGAEIIYRTSDGAILTPLNNGDMVFNNESTKRLYEFANNPEAFMKKYNIAPSAMSAIIPKHVFNSTLPDFISTSGNNSAQNMNVGDINVNMELPNVTDYKDFRNQLISDSTFEKAMFTSINHALTGKGTPFDKLKHTR